MNEIEKQMLENQFVIMETLRSLTDDETMNDNLEKAETSTISLLGLKSKKESEEPSCDMDEFAKSEKEGDGQ